MKYETLSQQSCVFDVSEVNGNGGIVRKCFDSVNFTDDNFFVSRNQSDDFSMVNQSLSGRDSFHEVTRDFDKLSTRFQF